MESNLVTKLVDMVISWLPQDMQDKAKGARKAIVAGLGALLTVLTTIGKGPFGFLIPANLRQPIATLIPIITTVLTYLTPNENGTTGAAIDTSGA